MAKEAPVPTTGEPTEVVTKQETSSEVTSILQGSSFDYGKTLRDALERRNAAGIKSRELGVMFRDLQVLGVGATITYQFTMLALVNPIGAIINKIRSPKVSSTREILTGFEGVVRPGEMLLVLGQPGSGCTTFLKTIANQRDSYAGVLGDVFYDSLTPEEVRKHYRGDVLYCEDDDIHFPTLNVQQTIHFAAEMRTPQARADGQSRQDFTDETTHVLTTVFGLNHALKTPVGNAAIRGVSGGEKKRISISEALASRSLINCWDNSTRGLDASTALEFGNALRQTTDINRLTTIVSIYQAGESLYEVFDKVCVIYEGRLAYFGPANLARQYFIDLGYEPHDRQTTADFLVSVTDTLARIRRSDLTTVIPSTAAEFAEYFLKSPLGLRNREDMETYQRDFVGKPEKALEYKESAHAEHAKHASLQSPFIESMAMQVRAVMRRRVLIMIGNKAAFILTLVAYILQAILVGTVFLRTTTTTAGFFSRGGVLFFSLFFHALIALAEIPTLYAQRPIILKHRKAAMYHPFIEALATTLTDAPITALISLTFCTILYNAVRLQQSASQFFTFYLFIFTMSLVMKGMWRMIASAFASPVAAQAFAGPIILSLVLYTGYTIPKPSMIVALRWISYINPLRYGFEGILSSEFHTIDGLCTTLVPRGPGYQNVSIANQVCTTVGSVPGSQFVNGERFIELSFGYSYANLWMNYGILVTFGTGFILLYMFFTQLNQRTAGTSSVTVFKRGTKINDSSSSLPDEEKASPSPRIPARQSSAQKSDDTSARITSEDRTYTWQNITYTIELESGEKRRLLDDVSGYVGPGLTALMGESGAGKTTLLNVLAERYNIGKVTGACLVDGHALPGDFHQQTGYCEQQDVHLPEMTVREALLFSARLRQSSSTPDAEKVEYVETCIRMCGLEYFADAIIGSLGIEQQKRTTIAVELAAKPKLLLFVDEPTSSLDSQSAFAIMECLRGLADRGQAILCTIHQPSAELFDMFDRLLLLRKGGQTVYCGDLGKNAVTLIDYFENQNARKIRPLENPAEYMLQIIGAGATATTDQDWHEVWRESKESRQLDHEIEELIEKGRKKPPLAETHNGQFAASWFYQTFQLIKRGFSRANRDPNYLRAKMMLNIIGGLFVGFTFWRAADTIQGTQNKLFACFMACVLSVPLSNQLQIPFLKTRSIFEIREKPSNTYHWSALITSQYVTEIPFNIIGSSLFFFCWYWTVGFPTERAGYTYLMHGVMFPLYYSTIAQAVAAMAPNVEIAGLLFSMIFAFVLFFNGVVQPFRALGWWQWTYRLSPYTYQIEGILGQAVGGQLVNCAPVEFVSVDPPSGQTCGQYMGQYIDNFGGYVTDTNATASCQYCAVRTTDEFLQANFNIYYQDHWRNFGFLAVYVIFNISCIYLFTYFFRIRTGSLIRTIKKRLSKRSV